MQHLNSGFSKILKKIKRYIIIPQISCLQWAGIRNICWTLYFERLSHWKFFHFSYLYSIAAAFTVAAVQEPFSTSFWVKVGSSPCNTNFPAVCHVERRRTNVLLLISMSLDCGRIQENLENPEPTDRTGLRLQVLEIKLTTFSL